MRNYDNLVDYEFERLVANLFSAMEDIRYERFTRGRDEGIDLRRIRDNGEVDVVQVKHYKGSSYSTLKTAARQEAERLPTLEPQPSSYRLVTSQGLTPHRKHELAELLSPYVQRDDEVFGREDIDDLLDRFPGVERASIKLTLSSSTALQALVHAGVHARSRQLALDIQRRLPLWVQGECYFEARKILFEHSVCVIAGPPGVGKTTLAQMLVAEAIDKDFEPIEVSADIAEAWDVFDPDTPQVFLYDDFLGHTTLLELTKNEDSRLVSFMAAVAESPRTLLVLTTREYILQRAVLLSEALRRSGLSAERFLLTPQAYGRLDRAKILHHHVWHSGRLDPEAREQLPRNTGYARIVDHSNFTPRLVEYVTGLQAGHALETAEGPGWLDAAVEALDHPEEIWRHAYANQIGAEERALLLALGLMPSPAHQDDLRIAHDALCEELGINRQPRGFTNALGILDDTFVRTYLDAGAPVVQLLNPGLSDFLERELLADPAMARELLRSARYFEQLNAMRRLVEREPESQLALSIPREVFFESARRLLDTHTAVWIRHARWDGRDELRRWRTSVEARLETLISFARTSPTGAKVLQWLEECLVERVDAWRRGEGDEWALFGLARELTSPGRPSAPEEWAIVMKDRLRADPVQAEIWGYLDRLHDLVPDAFSDDDWNDIRASYVSWAEYELLHNAGEMRSDDELFTIESVAEDFGVKLDPEAVENARSEIDERLALEDQAEEERLQEWREEGRFLAQRSDDENIDDLFWSFADRSFGVPEPD